MIPSQPFDVIHYAATAAAVYIAGTIIYRLTLHPLAKFPGPKMAAVSNLYISYVMLSGRSHIHLSSLHKKYGPVLRIAPNELSFGTATSFKDIYARSGNRKYFEKGAYYDGASAFSDYAGLPLQTSAAKHSIQHKIFAPAFSHTAQTEFANAVMRKYILTMIKKLRGPGHTHENIIKWFQWTFTDVSTDFIFGQAFNELENEDSHPWNKVPANAVFMAQVVEAVRRCVGSWVITMVGPVLFKGLRKRVMFTKECILQRLREEHVSDMATGTTATKKKNTKDIFTYILASPAGRDLATNLDDLAQNIFEVLGASIETTVSTVSSMLYYILTTPSAHTRLTAELRTSFRSITAIKMQDLLPGKLPYLDAVINEGLRMFPAVPQGLPRDSPGETVDGIFIPPGVIVSTPTYTTAHAPEYWREPERFWPERWMEGEAQEGVGEKKDTREASMPYLCGPRACIGQVMNQHEVRLMLAMLLYAFDLELDGEMCRDWVERCRVYMVWRKPALWVTIKEREGGVPGL